MTRNIWLYSNFPKVFCPGDESPGYYERPAGLEIAHFSGRIRSSLVIHDQEHLAVL